MGRWRKGLEEDIDEVAVRRAITGDIPTGITRAELCAAAGELRRRGMFHSEIASILGIDTRQVVRFLERLGMTGDRQHPIIVRSRAPHSYRPKATA